VVLKRSRQWWLQCCCVQDGSSINRRDNPHKYLLYKPTISQLFTFLASGFKELPPTGVMLLYLSADGCLGNAKHSDDSKSGTWTFWCRYTKIQQQPFNGPLSGTTWVSWYQKKHSPVHTHLDHQPSFIHFLRLLWSIESSLFNLLAWQFFSITFLQVLSVCGPLLHTPCILMPKHFLRIIVFVNWKGNGLCTSLFYFSVWYHASYSEDMHILNSLHIQRRRMVTT